MGEKDIITKKMMEREDFFADAFNYLLFDGEQVLCPENLQEMDTTAITVLDNSGNDASASVQKFRDLFKRALVKRDHDKVYLLLGIENQSDIHYAMPVRNMLYDALRYDKQVTKGTGVGKYSKLDPVITLVIYYSDDIWDAPISLHEMFRPIEPKILEFVPDYRINLIAPAMMSDSEIDKFQSNLREVMLCLKHSKDKEALDNLLKNDRRFESVLGIAVKVIKKMTDMTDFKVKSDEEAVNMCKAMEEIKKEQQKIGIEKGIEKGIETVTLQMLEMGMSVEIIAKVTSLSVNEIEKIAEKVGDRYCEGNVKEM